MKEEFLNEEKYQNTKKKISKVSLIILVCGLLLGGCLIGFGIFKQTSLVEENKKAKEEAELKLQQDIAAKDTRLGEIEIKMGELNQEKEKKEYECNSLDMRSPSWFADNNKCENEVSKIDGEISALKMEQFRLEHANYELDYNEESGFKYIPFYMFGGFIIIASLIISLSIYLSTKRREMISYRLQEMMPVAGEAANKMAPVAGEVMEKMAPSVGKVSKEIAKGIAEGIKEGKE